MKSQFEDIWNRIEAEKIKPLPQWIIVLQRMSTWAGFTISVLFGAVTLAYFVFILQNLNAEVFISRAPWELISIAPLVWLVTFIIFLGLAFWSVEHTDSGYKIHFSLWILGNIALTTIGALFLVAMEVPRSLEPGIHALIPPLSATRMEERLWHTIPGGRLQGEVISLSENSLILREFGGEEWEVLILPHTRMEVTLTPDIDIRVMGKTIDEDTLEAEIIIPADRPLKKPAMKDKKPLLKNIPGKGNIFPN